jgi:rhodanese-related sulfurtransferase
VAFRGAGCGALLVLAGLACHAGDAIEVGDVADAVDDHPVVNGVRQVPADELHDWLHDDASAARIVDVRILYDWRRGHVPGAASIPGAAVVVPETGEPLDGGRALLERFPDFGTRLVFYCSGAECNVSQVVGEAARQVGYTDVWRLDGGYPAWLDAGFEAAVSLADFCDVPFFPVPAGEELVDVRPAGAFGAGTIPGASSLPRETFLDAGGRPVAGGVAFTAAVGNGPDPDWVLASSAGEALEVAAFAVGAGYRSLRLLEGDWADWTATACAAGAGP